MALLNASVLGAKSAEESASKVLGVLTVTIAATSNAKMVKSVKKTMNQFVPRWTLRPNGWNLHMYCWLDRFIV